jgi:hypothetical protein
MKQTIYAPNTVPTATLAVNKSRIKIYKNAGDMPTYYLQKGQEFQIELFNPTSDVVLAKVILNGKAISQGGLVLNPGQRVFLERYLDVAKKFLFDTYEVANTSEVKKAIESNGDFKVEFYKERQNNQILYSNNYNGTLSLGNYNSGTPINNLRTTTTTNINGVVGGSSTFTSSINGNTSAFYNSNVSNTKSLGNITLDSVSFDDEVKSEPKRMKSKLSKSIETGRVEMGSNSDQEFKMVNKTFEYSPFYTIEYKMLPVSQKINTIDDIQVKVYCTNCGAKLGKTDKFCASCGTKK